MAAPNAGVIKESSKRTTEGSPILSVTALTKQIKNILEPTFSSITVSGEISNFKSHHNAAANQSGHWYFSLKDAESQIACAMWKSNQKNLFFQPEDGMRVIVSGRVTVYPPRGSYQLDVTSMSPAGEGELQMAFERLKRKLAAEGLFEKERKKQIPKMPLTIGIVTSKDGAAFRDMISTAARRFPIVKLILAPCKVQGAGAAEAIVEAIALLNREQAIDVIIVGRGGGSIEDLWAFNEEIVARAIARSRIPIISGVGHETDTTISDFAADMRAATPTAAMELATPNRDAITAYLKTATQKMTANINTRISEHRALIEWFLDSRSAYVPLDIIKTHYQQVDFLYERLSAKIDKRILTLKHRISELTGTVKMHDIRNVQKKGFVLVSQGNTFVIRSNKLNPQSEFSLAFFDGSITIPARSNENKTE